ncbi:MAG TPA: glycosyltransferase family 39 protein [Candidatus Sulfotelmatobacter sp.]|nr:glycosyltransferase family 39 protein [Candidatus Sulfotelmatobacter sp.]
MVAAFFHPIGDSYTENDFYGGYAAGAAALRHGVLDPHRYAAYGPVYELTLALAQGPGWDAFACAKFLSVLAAAGTLFCWLAMLAPLLGSLGAALAILFVAVTPVFTRYAYAATTDMLATFLASLAIALRLRRSGAGASVAAGAIAALATLTRYQMIFVALAGLSPLFARPGALRERGAWREVAEFGAGFLALFAPWTWFACAHGAPPAAALYQHYGFYASSDASRNYQDAAGSAPESLGWDAASSFARVASSDPLALLKLWAGRAVEHLWLDARILVGPWLGALALAGILLWPLVRRGRGIGAIAALGLIAHLTLVPVFYSHRYRLPLIPFECALAAAALLWLGSRGPRARTAAAVLALIAIVTLTARNVAAQRELYLELPRDVLALAPRLRREPDTLRVVSRRGHIGYYTGRLITPFPRVQRLPELAAAARAGGAGYLYFSWYEARLRPEFLYLLDTTATVPGLERLATCEQPPAILYRLGPEFGKEPEWLMDSYQRRVHESRAAIRIYPDADAAPARAVLAADTLLHGHARAALAMAREARGARPDLALAWRVEGAALQLLGDSLGARAALDRAARAAREDTLPSGAARSSGEPPFRR